MLLSVNGSPYEIDKDDRRLGRVFADRVAETRLPLVYLNRVGGQDELVFDGCSFILDGDGRTLHRLVDWEEEERVTHWRKGADGRWTRAPGAIAGWAAPPAALYHQMMVGPRRYVERNRLQYGGADGGGRAGRDTDIHGVDGQFQ